MENYVEKWVRGRNLLGVEMWKSRRWGVYLIKRKKNGVERDVLVGEKRVK